MVVAAKNNKKTIKVKNIHKQQARRVAVPGDEGKGKKEHRLNMFFALVLFIYVSLKNLYYLLFASQTEISLSFSLS